MVGWAAFHNTAWYNSQPINDVVYLGDIAYTYKYQSRNSVPDNLEIVLKDGVKSITSAAFSGLTQLKAVTIPEGTICIGSGAFYYTGLKEVKIPNSVKYIGDLIWPTNESTSIGAFYWCSELEKVSIGSSAEFIGSGTFAGCSALKDLYCLAPNPPFVCDGFREGVNTENITLHVPEASLESYRASEVWSKFGAIVAIDQPDNPKVTVQTFTLNCARGYVGYNGSSLCGTSKENASQFAIIDYGNTNYLYDATHKNFVVHTVAAQARTVGNLALESRTDLGKAVTGLTWGETGFPAYPWYLEDSFGNWMNMDNKPSVYMNTWKDFEGGNGGNTYQMTIVNTEYDATEALELLDVYFHPNNTVCYVFEEPGGVVTRSEPMGTVAGTVINSVPTELQKDYCFYTVTPATMKSGENTVQVKVTWDLPFDVSESYDAAAWYYAKIRYNYYICMDDTEPYFPTAVKQEEDRFQWAFMGTPHTGFIILNKAAGADQCLTKVGNYALMRAGSTERWELIRNLAGFNLLRFGSEQDYITQYGSNAGYLGFWVDTRGRTDDGGMWQLEAVPTGISDINQMETGAAVWFTPNGIQVTRPVKGVNIIRAADGTTRKVLVK